MEAPTKLRKRRATYPGGKKRGKGVARTDHSRRDTALRPLPWHRQGRFVVGEAGRMSLSESGEPERNPTMPFHVREDVKRGVRRRAEGRASGRRGGRERSESRWNCRLEVPTLSRKAGRISSREGCAVVPPKLRVSAASSGVPLLPADGSVSPDSFVGSGDIGTPVWRLIPATARVTSRHHFALATLATDEVRRSGNKLVTGVATRRTREYNAIESSIRPKLLSILILQCDCNMAAMPL